MKSFNQMSSAEQLQVCNLTSKGMPLKDAVAKVNEKLKAEAAATQVEEPGKPVTAAEKKAAIATKLQELGVELPSNSDSVAKWEEALAEAEAAKQSGEVKTTLEGGEGSAE